MLEKIRFYEFDVKGSSLTILNDDSEGGRYRIKFSAHDVTPQNDEDGNWLFIDITPTISGYSNPEGTEDSEDEEVFVAEANLTLTFQCNLEEEITEDFYNENQWFFDNYIYVCTKIVFEKLFKDSVLEMIDLPWSPKFKDNPIVSKPD